eukprot:XP_001696586.1 predicted protein [Chlamydomonas reinhardtii]
MTKASGVWRRLRAGAPTAAAAPPAPKGFEGIQSFLRPLEPRQSTRCTAHEAGCARSANGFIHLTAEPRFLLGVGNQFYKDVAGTFLLLVLDYEKLSAKVIWGDLGTGVIFEPAAPVGSKSSDGLSAGGEAKAKEELPLFPHLYGTIDFGAVTAELPIERDASGAFLSIPGLDAAAAP